MKGNDIFSYWCYHISQLKKKFRTNKLVKHLGEPLGNSNKKECYVVDEDKIGNYQTQLENDEWEVFDKITNKKGSYYILKKNQYDSFNYRIKHFLTAYARNKTARLALKDINNVIRIHTDAVSFIKPVDVSEIHDLKLEKKLTGCIEFENVNKYSDFSAQLISDLHKMHE